MRNLMRKIENWKNMIPEIISVTADNAKKYKSGQEGKHCRDHWIRCAYYDLRTEIEFARRFINKITEKGGGAE